MMQVVQKAVDPFFPAPAGVEADTKPLDGFQLLLDAPKILGRANSQRVLQKLSSNSGSSKSMKIFRV